LCDDRDFLSDDDTVDEVDEDGMPEVVELDEEEFVEELDVDEELLDVDDDRFFFLCFLLLITINLL
jgi:hypothetical protein